MRRFLVLFGISAFAAGCVGGGSPDAPGGSSSPGAPAVAVDPDAEVFAGLPRGADSLKALCGRGHSDLVARGLCAASAPMVEPAPGLRQTVACLLCLPLT